MKKTPFIAIIFSLIATSPSYAASDNCASLKESITKKLEALKSNSNDETENEVLGYQQALKAITQKCDVSTLVNQSTAKIEKSQSRITKLHEESTQVEEKMAEALASNNEKKIAQLEELINNQQQELAELQDALEVEQAQLDALQSTK